MQGSQVSRIHRETHAFQPVHTLSRHTLYFSRWEVRYNLYYRYIQLIDEGQEYGGKFSAKFIAVSSYTELNTTYQPIRN